MRIFVTGATGFVGSAITRELLEHGHRVLALARSQKAIDVLTKAGAQAHRGELTDVESLASGAKACDGVIHTAFIHDFSRYKENAGIDKSAVESLASALNGSDKPLVAVSVTTLLPQGRLVTEQETPEDLRTPRAESEEAVLVAANYGVRACVIRLPSTVHGAGDRGFIPGLIDIARRKGTAVYIGSGSNCWPAVHRLDAARLFRLAIEGAQPGARFHAVAEEGVSMRSIAETIGRGLNVPVRSISEDKAQSHFDCMARFVAIDNPASSTLTRSTFGWWPQFSGLLTAMQESGHL